MAMNPKLLRPRASGFNPKSISGLSLWLDAGDTSTITLNGSNVSEWRDKSGGSPNASQATAASQPAYTANGLNGRATIDFDSTEFLSFAASTGAFNYLHNSTGGTIFLVVRPDASSNPNDLRYILNNSSNSSANVGIALTFDDRASVTRNNALLVTSNRGVSGQSSASIVANNFFARADAHCVLSVVLDSGNATAASRLLAYHNGVLNATTNVLSNAASSANASANMFIGNFGGGGAVYSMSEILFYQGVLGASQRVAVERYLGKKYGISVA